MYLRAGWSLGNVQDRYIFAGSGGDQLVGRAVSGLPVNESSFAILPPHFSPSTIQEISEYGWNNILADYESYPECFRNVVPYLLASLLYHLPYLKDTLHVTHPLWNCRLFQSEGQINGQNAVQYLQSKVLLGTGRCSETNLQATGVPPHLVLSYELEKLREAHVAVVEELRNEFRQHLDAVTQAIKKNPTEVGWCLYETITCNIY